ncbi:hypothetical protein H3Z83_06920 [Tenacibaculum sp. S7007]|uniref:Uncharacterized protein n=1 Tax=Tenacibaculum pelagium TaxID=2759527 RepID=A0A839ARH4_9FLAO|nr:hypothetical protein [Tenacibaculum pelagium]MBA6156251.1 hypothetical protein [Tenacibaculum pelagium]
MENFLKRFHRGIYPILIILFILLLDKVFLVERSWIQTAVAIAVAYVLSPRKKIVQTQTGERKQLTWIFLKKPIFLD